MGYEYVISILHPPKLDISPPVSPFLWAEDRCEPDQAMHKSTLNTNAEESWDAG